MLFPDSRQLRDIARIAIPVSLEAVSQLLLGFIDQIIVGTLGALAIAAVGLANSTTFIFILTLAALGNSCAILTARAYGAKNTAALSQSANVGLLSGFLISLLVVLPMWIWAEPLMAFAGGNPQLDQPASSFLKVMLLSLPLVVLGSVSTGTLRSMGDARTPMKTTMVSMLINTVLAYLLVSVFDQGVLGAAWGTLLANLIKTLWLLHTLYQRSGVRFQIPGWKAIQSTLRELLPLSTPMMVTELFWTSSVFIYNILFGKLSTQALAANQIVNTLETVFVVASFGLASAATTLLGQAIGQGDTHLAQHRSRAILKMGILTGLVTGLLYFGTAFLLPTLFRAVETEVLNIAFLGVVLNALFQAVKVHNMIQGIGILPSGGDPRGVLFGDVFGAFAVGLPLAVWFGFGLGWGAAGIFSARLIEEAVKLLIFHLRYRKINWQRLAQHLQTA
ncbi:MATE family efflux transporter [Deinococcus roseus]|uniref:Multidrug-efflux transporter n=1 Tax=Deinococcus roseus TaxID=392414 RepID=A0ABQ2CY76_9DEIO|nr:MATE family efflux transporter [Deinococcus roseus]GGJ32610.1 MATE family efflux transporter [Deinococcus roseus]